MSRHGNKVPDNLDHLADFKLVEAILAGSEIAWHAFIERYGGLINHVTRRYLFDEDEVATVFADVLEALFNGKLATYQGRSSLATWLILVSRNAAADALRHRFGRRDLPRGLRELDKFHCEVYRIYYVEGNTFGATLKELQLQIPGLDDEELLKALRTIEEKVSDRTLRRISYDLAAQSIGAASGRLLEYCEHLRQEVEERESSLDPLDLLVTREAEARALEALKLVARLPRKEQEILSLRFDKGMRAKDIATQLGFDGQRKVFTVLDRIVRRLRRLDRQENDSDKKIKKNVN